MTERERIERVLRQIDRWVDDKAVEGAVASVWRRGEVVTTHVAGEANPAQPVERDSVFALASVTKPITAACVMSLVEEGAVALDEPVGRLVPEFGEGPDANADNVMPEFERLRRQITVRQLLSHASGLPEDMAPGKLRYQDQFDLATLTTVMCRQPLRAVPGTEHLYSNAGIAVLSRLVEKLTGNDFWDETKRRVLDPLGLHNTVARPGHEWDERIARVTDAPNPGAPYESYNSVYWRDLALPWGGLYGSAPDMATFAGAFLPGGPRLLSRASVQAMTTDQVQGLPGGVQSMKVTWNPAFWGLGWEVKGSKRRHWTGDLTSPSTFCHFGAAGTLLWADPERDVALAVFGNRTVTHLWPFLPARWSRLCNALIAAVD